MRRVRRQFSRRVSSVPRRWRDPSSMTAAVALALGFSLAGPIASASALFPDRAYELVSPGSTDGQAGVLFGLNADGTVGTMISGGGFAETPSVDGVVNRYMSMRTPVGWATRPLNLPLTEFATPGLQVDALPDLSATLHRGATREQERFGQHQYYFRWSDGSLTPASPVIQNGRNLNSWDITAYLSGARDLSSFVIDTTLGPLLSPPDASPAANKPLYEVFGTRTASPSMRRVDVNASGTQMSAGCGAVLGGSQRLFNAVSANGSRIFFSARPAAITGCAAATRGPERIYARVNGSQTVEISESRCTRTVPGSDPPVSDCLVLTNAAADRQLADHLYQGASRSGGSVFFTTGQQLMNSDTGRAQDLYEYRFGTGSGSASLTHVSAGAPAGTTATVLGATRISEDGRRVYYVAQGVLATNLNAAGQQAVDGARNLYLYERTSTHPNGRTVFVATLDASDSALWGGDARPAQLADDDGRYLVIGSVTQLTEDDGDNAIDVFRYDADTGDMLRISRGKNGYSNDGNQANQNVSIYAPEYVISAWVGAGFRAVSRDGSRVVFRTSEALQSDDVNEGPDIYEWRDGVVELVTPGRSDLTLYAVPFISEDGSAIGFSTAEPLVPEDIDPAVSAYVARVGGGFEHEAPEPEVPCEGDACQGPTAEPLVRGGVPTAGLVGSGNAVPTRDSVDLTAITASQRRQAARTGRLVLKVRTSSGGRVTATVSARIASSRGTRRRVRTVGSAKVNVAKAGVGRLTLRLSPAARSQLRASRQLTITVRVRFSKTRDRATERFTLRAPATKGGKA